MKHQTFGNKYHEYEQSQYKDPGRILDAVNLLTSLLDASPSVGATSTASLESSA